MIYFIMGVSGSGKSTIGQLLADHLALPYIEADDHHPAANIDKMKKGLALNDLDRVPWLNAIREVAVKAQETKGAVISCSALKQSYRDILTKDLENYCRWIYLAGDYEDIHTRMKLRDHFMPESLLLSQFDILEEPVDAIKIDIRLSPSEIISNIVSLISKKVI